mmetsp:Transcript_25444/g.95899  ORF Transcript_25444/g.95899 Transcript_25444/m.95899 type:complete len:286 (+) Transcript_25444:577-1434(+)
MALADLPEHCEGVVEGCILVNVHPVDGVAEGFHVTESHGHAAPGEGVAHVPSVAEEEGALDRGRASGEALVDARDGLLSGQRVAEDGPHALGQLVHDAVLHVAAHPALLGGGHAWDIDEDAGQGGGDLVEEDGVGVGHDNMASVRVRDAGLVGSVVEKVAHEGGGWDRVSGVEAAAHDGEHSIRNHDERRAGDAAGAIFGDVAHAAAGAGSRAGIVLSVLRLAVNEEGAHRAHAEVNEGLRAGEATELVHEEVVPEGAAARRTAGAAGLLGRDLAARALVARRYS